MEYIFNLDKNNIKGDGIFMKKIIMLVILAMTVVGCELFSPSYWNEVDRRRAERGVECYERYDGTVYCKDRNGNRY